MRYDELLEYLVTKEGENVRSVFLSSLTLLFILGKLEYHVKTDSLEVLA